MWSFLPIYKQTVWGGSAIAPFKGARTGPTEGVGESWEVSGLEGNLSVVADGPDRGLTLPELIDRYGAALMGRAHLQRFGRRFPLLVKLLDAARDLSVQVHPDSRMAGVQGLPNGKDELWYVLQTRPGARLCAGFSREVSRDDYPALVEGGQITEHLNYRSVAPGEAYYIPAGTVHALCAGCLVLEIQQSLDVTYRIFDYQRPDKDGHLRELHTELAMDALHFGPARSTRLDYDRRAEKAELLRSPQFNVNRLRLPGPMTQRYGTLDAFKLLCVAQGAATLASSSGNVTARQGSVLLVGADERNVRMTPLEDDTIIIETFIDPQNHERISHEI